MIGIDIGATKTEAALIEEGNVIHTLREATQKHSLVEQAARLAEALGAGKPVGIGIAGQVHEGVVLKSPNIGLTHFPLQKLLEERLNVPVAIANDVQAAAYGEIHFGAAKGSKRLIVAQLGTGIGGAVAVNGEVLSGTVGEIGHMVITQSGLPCSCGRHGCLEAYASGWAIAKYSGKPSAKEAFESPGLEITQAFDALVTGLTNLANLFNPDMLLLGGGLLRGYLEADPNFFDTLYQAISKEMLALPFNLKRASLPTTVGAASILYSVNRKL